MIRDLRDNSLMRTDPPFVVFDEVRSRFSNERWRSFVADHQHYLEQADADFFFKLRTDHGYNPSPAWTFAARLFSTGRSGHPDDLARLALLDIVLLGAMFAAIFGVYGLRVGCTSLVLFGFGYAWRFWWNGGSLLRFTAQ